MLVVAFKNSPSPVDKKPPNGSGMTRVESMSTVIVSNSISMVVDVADDAENIVRVAPLFNDEIIVVITNVCPAKGGKKLYTRTVEVMDWLLDWLSPNPLTTSSPAVDTPAKLPVPCPSFIDVFSAIYTLPDDILSMIILSYDYYTGL